MARAPRWSGRALLGLFIFLLLVMALLERLGLQTIATASLIAASALLLFSAIALLSPARRPADYYVADREITPGRGGMAAAGTVAGLLAIGAAAGMFATGAEILSAAAGLLLGCLLLGAVFAPRLRRFGGHTVGDFFAARFGFRSRLVGGAVAFASSFLLLIATLGAAGPLLANFVDLTPWQGLLAAAAVAAAAVLPGGTRSLTAVQGLQYAVAILACLVPVAFVAVQSGGLTLPDLSSPGLDWLRAEIPTAVGPLAGMAFPVLLIAVQAAALPQMLAQGPSARSGRAAMAAFGWAIVFSLLLLLGALLFGQAILAVAGAPADAITGELILSSGPPLEALPPVLAGLAMAGMLAILLAFGQAALFAATSAFSHDLWDELLDRQGGGGGGAGRRVFVARLAAVALAAAAAWIASVAAPYTGALLGWGLALAVAGNFAPLLLGLWWSRCNAYGAVAGMATGAAIVGALFVLDPGGSVTTNVAAVGLAGSFASAIIASLITAPPPAEQAALVRSLRRGAPGGAAARRRPEIGGSLVSR